MYDSISQPVQAWFLSRASFPARAALYRVWLGRAEVLAKQYKMAILALNHATRDPVFPERCVHWGGAPVSYSFKFSLCLEGYEGRIPTSHLDKCLNKELAENAPVESLRAVWIYRHPTYPPYGACVLLKLNQDGIFTC